MSIEPLVSSETTSKFLRNAKNRFYGEGRLKQ